ncbi:FAA hydrolase family protein [Caulobacter sp. SLTY]|uniref:fumarylacetoacetate hydrolase family protein n=1 Tax=Caulobacter sp. SLTY TaxID=2683262 RepID=UPI0014134062|nr:fumarylacetoacetate hydrolase family protein [Caulobacter sp. SLTY]NBB14131.1 FAA hydrolase family protein [Caulobacter sp. SLTY]
MPDHAFPLRPTPTVPVDGDKPFPVRRILCVGRNYAAHRAEMGGDDRDPPFFFAKPADAIVPPGQNVAYPSATANLHHEIELVVAIGPDGIFGYAVGVDLTRRDLQSAAKDKGQPWDAAKGFDQSAPISAISKLDSLGDAAISLSVNGEVRQKARIGDMLWSVPEIVEQAGLLWSLQPGDLIFTGTPEGVGPLQKGDLVEGSVEGIGSLSFEIV